MMISIRWAITLLLLHAALTACSSSTLGDAGEGMGDAGALDVGPEERPLSPLTEVCPRQDGAPLIGDVNGDAVTDIADAIALQSHLFRGGPGPVCPAAANFDGDPSIELDDAERISMFLLTGEQIPRVLGERECDTAVRWPQASCAPLALDLLAPLRVKEERLIVQVALRSPALAVQGFSLSLEASGCALEGVTTEGTIAAEVWDEPPGLRHLGWGVTTLVSEGAIAYLILSTTDDVNLPMSSDPVPVLSAQLRASVPASGCSTCVIGLRDGLAWRGQPIDTTIVANGRAFAPALPRIEVEVCAE